MLTSVLLIMLCIKKYIYCCNLKQIFNMKDLIFNLFFIVKMTEMWKNQSEEWTSQSYLFPFITVNKYRFWISVIGKINMQIIGIGYEKINIGRSLPLTFSTIIMVHHLTSTLWNETFDLVLMNSENWDHYDLCHEPHILTNRFHTSGDIKREIFAQMCALCVAKLPKSIL